MFPQYISSYLNRFGGEPPVCSAPGDAPYNFVIVIPAMDEKENIPAVLQSLAECTIPIGCTFAVMVTLNHSVSSPEHIKQANRETAEFLFRTIAEKRYPFPLIVNDLYSPATEMPDKTGGVGLARKTGLDAALRLLNYTGVVQPFLVCLDADCLVSPNYLIELWSFFSSGVAGAVSISYSHRLPAGNEEADAILFYEIYLRYYVYMLKRCGLPYAIQAIGSSMAFTASVYCKSEGMNKYKAGEDFYFLEKTAKHTPVAHLKNAVVYPSARISYRVPFGTGRAMEDFLIKKEEYGLLYSPESFEALAEIYTLLTGELPEEKLTECIKNSRGKNLLPLLKEKKLLSKREKILTECKTPEQRLIRLTGLFDGFSLLKSIHFLRDNGFDPFPYRVALDAVLPPEEISRINTVYGTRNSTEIKQEYLNLLRATE